MLEVVRNDKNSIFLHTLLNLSLTKSPLIQYYPKSVPSTDILIILLPQNDKVLVLAKILFLTIFFYLSNVNQLHKYALVGQTSTSNLFQTGFPSHV